jgi:hypothetical protein
MSVTLDCDAKKKNIFYGGDSDSNKCQRDYSSAYGGAWRSLRLEGVWNLAVWFCVREFGRNLASVAVFFHIYLTF